MDARLTKDLRSRSSLSVQCMPGRGCAGGCSPGAHLATHTAQIPGARKLTREAQELRDEIAQKMAPEQILEAEQLAREWKPKRER